MCSVCVRKEKDGAKGSNSCVHRKTYANKYTHGETHVVRDDGAETQSHITIVVMDNFSCLHRETHTHTGVTMEPKAEDGGNRR